MDNNNAGIGAGLLIFLIVLYIAFAVAFIWAYVNIIRRAGYPGAWVLIGLVPIANIVFFFIFAFKEWPVTRELNWLRSQVHGNQGGYPGGPGGQGGPGGPGGGYGGGYPPQQNW